MKRHKRNLIVFAIFALVAVALMTVLIWPPNQSFVLKVKGFERSGMRDVYGEALLVTLSIEQFLKRMS